MPSVPGMRMSQPPRPIRPCAVAWRASSGHDLEPGEVGIWRLAQVPSSSISRDSLVWASNGAGLMRSFLPGAWRRRRELRQSTRHHGATFETVASFRRPPRRAISYRDSQARPLPSVCLVVKKGSWWAEASSETGRLQEFRVTPCWSWLTLPGAPRRSFHQRKRVRNDW